MRVLWYIETKERQIMYKFLLVILLSFIFINLGAELNYRKFFKNRSATKEWNNENFVEAEQLFRENAIENPNMGDFHFNRGTALYKMEEYDEALREFQIALNDRKFSERDKIYHNMGNIAYHKNEYGDALDLYKRALLENPQNLEARKNYEYVRMIPPPPQEEDQQQSESQQQESEEDDNEQKQPPPPDEEDPDKKEAERMLQALEQKQEQEKEQEQTRGRPSPRGRYW